MSFRPIQVLQFANLAAFPVTGETAKLYIDKTAKKLYWWNGTAYETFSGGGVGLGETDVTAYRGDRGKVAFDHSQANGNPHGTTAAQIGAVGATELAKIGTEWLNLKSRASWTGGTDITNAMNEAINVVNARSPSGGQILIPQGNWTSNGGHSYGQTMQFRGAGYSLDAGGSSYRGSCLRLNAGSQFNYMFFVGGNTQNAGLFDLMVDCSAKQGTAIGLWIYGTTGNFHLKTELDGVFFKGGRFGIKNESAGGTNFQNDGFSATGCAFQNCQTVFYCNSVNGSFYFNKPVIYLPYNGVGFDVPLIGTLVVRDYHITGTSGYNSANEVIDYSTILVTGGQHNRIAFYDGQCEQVRWFHQDNTNNHYPGSPILIKDCSIQSRFRPVAGVTYCIEDNYIVNHLGYPTFIDDISSNGLRIIKKGQNFVETRYAQNAVVIYGTSESAFFPPFDGRSILTYLTKPRSHVVDVRGNIRGSNVGEPYQDAGTPYNKPYRMPSTSVVAPGASTTINSTEATVNVAAGTTFFRVYNNTMYYNSADDSSIVQAWIEDEPGVTVSKCLPDAPSHQPSFIVYLSGATTAQRKINFKVLR